MKLHLMRQRSIFREKPVIKICISEKAAEAIKPIYDENSDNDEDFAWLCTNQQNSKKANILNARVMYG